MNSAGLSPFLPLNRTAAMHRGPTKSIIGEAGRYLPEDPENTGVQEFNQQW